MGKLIAVVTRFLSLSAVLLAIPTIADAQPTPIADLRPTAILYNSAIWCLEGPSFLIPGFGIRALREQVCSIFDGSLMV